MVIIRYMKTDISSHATRNKKTFEAIRITTREINNIRYSEAEACGQVYSSLCSRFDAKIEAGMATRAVTERKKAARRSMETLNAPIPGINHHDAWKESPVSRTTVPHTKRDKEPIPPNRASKRRLFLPGKNIVIRIPARYSERPVISRDSTEIILFDSFSDKSAKNIRLMNL